MVRAVIVVVGVLAAGACVRSESVVCSNGLVCPAETQCDEMHDACVVPDQRTACDGLDENALCTWADGAGACLDGVCLPHVCGDGRRSGPERCDPSDPMAMTTTCNSVELGYYETAEVTCAADCQWDTSPCDQHCGDGVLNGNEICEVGIAPVRTCIDYGFDRGTIGCAACAPGFDDCHLIGWTRRLMQGPPGPAVSVGDDVFVAMTSVGATNLAAQFDRSTGTWIELGTQPGIETTAAATVIGAGIGTDVWVGGTTGASGDAGFVARWNGTAWARVRTFPNAVRAIWVHDTHVFVITNVSTTSEVFVYDGTTWTTGQALVTTTTQFWISGSSSDDVWIGGGKLWHGGAAQAFAEVTLPVSGTVSGVSAFAQDQVAVAVFETSKLVLRIRENNTWRAATWFGTGTTGAKQGVPYARSANDVYMLISDLTTPFATRVAHYNGASWIPLSDVSSFKPTSLIASASSVIAFEHDLSVSWHYSGSAWVSLPVYVPTSGSAAMFEGPPGLIGPRADAVFSAKTDSFRGLLRFDGVGWSQEASARGRPASVPGAMYSADPNTAAIPRIWRWDDATSTWATNVSAPVGNQQLAEWIGVLGTNDMFFKTLVPGGPRYAHWAGATVFNGTSTEAVFEATNIPDGTLLDAIECRPSVGCYAISTTELWFTPGDRIGWAQQTPPAIGSMTSLAVGASLVVVGGTQGRVARFDGTSWTVDQLPSGLTVKLVVASGPKDIFVVTQSAIDDHELFHYNGVAWSRVRTPVPANGSKIDQLWTDGRVTYFGSGQIPTHFHALVRNETW